MSSNSGTGSMFNVYLAEWKLDMVYEEQRCNFCRVLRNEYGGIRILDTTVSKLTRLQDGQAGV